MGKIFGILLMVVGIWVGMEIYNNGLDGAFGGLLGSAEEGMQDARSIPERAGSAVRNAHADANERRNRMIGE